MFKNNEREDSTSHRHSKSIPLLRNLSDSGNDLLPLTTFTNKQINSTPYRRSISTSILPNSGDNFESTILHSRKRSDAHSIELQPLNENENLRRDSQVSTKITSGKDDRFGGHLYNDDNDIDDDGSRDNDSNNEEEHDDGENINDDNDDESDIYNKNKREDSLRTPLQNKFYYFFEEPLSNWAKAFETFSNLCTIANVVMICVVSWPTIYLSESQIYLNYWVPFDIIALITFTIEYLGRFYASLNKWKFFIKPGNLIDLISIVPFYAQLINHTESMLKFIRVLRLFRILRLFRVAKYTIGFNITARVFQRSAYQIVMISIYVLVILLASSALMYYIERGTFNTSNLTWYRTGKNGQQEVSPFQSIVHSFWWSIVTLTTTGYGDAVPVTGPGKFVAALTMTCGILVIALPTSIIGSNFNSEWALHRRLRFQMKLRQTREPLPDFTSKAKRIKVLQNQNQTMLEALAEIQERLADINPPRYYQKYKKLEIKHIEALERITDLENKLQRWKRIAQNLDTFHSNKFHRNDSDSGSGTDNAKVEEDINKISVWKWKNMPFRHFNTFSNRDVRRFASAEDGDKSKHKMKSSLLSPLKTLTKMGKSLTISKNSKLPEFSKELIGSPTELRRSFSPIIESDKNNNTRSVNRLSASNVSDILASEYIGDSEVINKNNTEENGNKVLSSDNVEDRNEVSSSSHYIISQDNQDNQNNSINKNDNNLINQNKQNTETEEIEIVVDKVDNQK